MHTNALSHLLGLLCIVSDGALGDTDSILRQIKVSGVYGDGCEEGVGGYGEHTESRSWAERYSWIERLRFC